MKENVKIMIVDDHPLFRKGTGLSITSIDNKCKIVAEAGNVTEAISTLNAHDDIDIIITDIILPDGNGSEIVKHVKKTKPDMGILAISGSSNKNLIVNTIEAGADGFLGKNAQAEDILQAIYAIIEGTGYFGKNTSALIDDIMVARNKNIGDKLSEREMEILQLCAKGMSAKGISESLYISKRTVETHKSHIFEKLGFNTTAELVNYAFIHGLVEL